MLNWHFQCFRWCNSFSNLVHSGGFVIHVIAIQQQLLHHRRLILTGITDVCTQYSGPVEATKQALQNNVSPQHSLELNQINPISNYHHAA